MANLLSKLINDHNASKVEEALLKEEYQKNRNEIITIIKEYLKQQDYASAYNYAKNYKEVASDDKVFIALYEESSNRLFAKQSKQLEYEKLTALLEVTPQDDSKKKYELCSKILEIDPNNQYYNNELIKYEELLGLRPVLSSDLRLGRRYWTKEIAGFYEPKDPDLKIPQDVVTVRLHTHGISIKHSKGIYRIHHSQIISIEYGSKDKESSFLAIAAGAVIGYALGDGLSDAIDGAKAANKLINSPDLLNILFWDIQTNSRNLICIRCLNKELINNFINDYHHEIEITKRTHRKPKSEENYFAKILIWLGAIIGFFWLLSTCFSNSDEVIAPNQSSKNTTSHQVAQEAANMPTNNLPPKNAANETPSNTWISSDGNCSINNSGTTLILNGTNAANAKLEIIGTGINNCKTTVLAIFDNKPPMSVNCSMSGTTIKLSTNAKFIKNMRNSNSMTLNIPNGTDEGKTIKYSLMGFSKACDWTK